MFRNDKVNYETFKGIILNRLSEKIPGPKQISVQKVHKNNGEIVDGMVILEDGVNIGPTIYLDHYYKKYQDGTDFSSVFDQILTSYENNKTDRRIDVGFFTEFERIRSRIVVKLINREKNMEQLNENVPHIPFLDLAIVFYCRFPVDPDIGNATIMINNSHISMWNTTANELYPIAMENTLRLLPPQIQSISKVLQGLLDIPDEIPEPENGDPLLPMYVLSNEDNLYGAVFLAYEGLIRSYAESFQSDLYILPSSIHEVIIVPCSEENRLEDFSKMVVEVNETQVAPEDILSDHAYYYSRERDEILY